MFDSPYNFIPTAPFVLYPEWAAQASHDHPFADGLCGELAIQLSNETPLCVGGRQQEATEQAAGRVHFYRTPDNQLAIPGSSLKGMLRNALAPVVFARMSQVEERKLSVRDISATGTYYYRNIVQQKASAGWLRFHQGQWQIRSCKHVRIHQRDIIDHLKLSERDWKNADTVKKRYALLKGINTLQFDQEPGKNLIRAVNLGKGKTTGSLVVTGQPGAVFDCGRSAKKWEFVFFDAQDDWQTVPQQAMRDFMFVHENSEEWACLRKQEHGQEEIPVFYHGSVSNISSMGLASMYRLAQQNSLHDALKNISNQHLDESKADLTELLFGRLQPQESAENGHNWGLRGRVNIGLLQAVENPRTDWTIDTVLSSPKPSFHPAYLQQQEGEYSTLDSRNPKLQGWKRYPVKPENVQEAPRMEDGRAVSNKVKVRLETVAEGSVFSGKIRFHNLRPVELGALLWILDFGERTELRHALGVGKPYGLGQVELKLQAEQSQVVANDRNALQGLAPNCVLHACRQVFTDYMDSVWQTAVDTVHANQGWEASPQVKSLREMADPQEGMKNDDSLLYLVGPKPFLDVKKNKEYLQLYASFTEANWRNEAITEGVTAGAELSVEQAMEKVAAQQQDKEQRRQLAEQRKSMSQGDRIISELAEQIAGKEELSSTDTKNFAKDINSITGLDQEQWPDPTTAKEVLGQFERFGKDRVNKAVTKVLKVLFPDD